MDETKNPKNSKGFRSDKYKMNKQTSIEICKHYIKDDERLSEIFGNNKKKDDLCDACLQAVAYIRQNSPDAVSKGLYNTLSFDDVFPCVFDSAFSYLIVVVEAFFMHAQLHG